MEKNSENIDFNENENSKAEAEKAKNVPSKLWTKEFPYTDKFELFFLLTFISL